MTARVPIRFFIDNCVPDSVGQVLIEAGHEAIFLRNVIASDSPDQIVAAICDQNNFVLVSLDKDFDQLHSRVGASRRRFKKLRRIKISCDEPRAASRIKDALSLIEHEVELSERRADKRMIVEVGHTRLTTLR